MNQLLVPLRASLSKLQITAPKGEPQNGNQRDAKVYRDDQIGVLKSIIQNLEKVLQSIMLVGKEKGQGQVPDFNTGSKIISSTSALTLLKTEFPEIHEEFIDGATAVLGFDISDPLALRGQDCEDCVWILWFAVLCFLTIASKGAPSSSSFASSLSSSFSPQSLTSRLLANLAVWYPLPSDSDPPVDPNDDPSIAYISDLVSSAASCYPESPDSMWVALDSHPLKPNIVAWASKVVSTEAFQWRAEEGGEGEEGETMYLLYMSAGGANDEKWMLEE